MGMTTTHDTPNGQTQYDEVAELVARLRGFDFMHSDDEAVSEAADLLEKQAKELEEWKAAFGRKFDAELTLIARVAEYERCIDMNYLTGLQVRIAELEKDYNELLMQVGHKFEGETRHQTALKYLRRAEEPSEISAKGKT